MTWFVKDTGYELFFNRDERLTRSQAQSPTKQQDDAGIQYISPTDTDAGGTWIAVNQFGITVCLLNFYQFEQAEVSKEWISRGEIVRNFAVTSDLSIAEDEIKAIDLDSYRAFRLFLIDPKGQNRLFVWDGNQLQIETNTTKPKSSSSVDTQEVKASRYQLFDDLKLSSSKSTQDYLDFHASHGLAKSKESVCMHREDAKTVSMSHIDVNSDNANFAYADGSPCSVPLQAPITLPLV